MSRVVVIGCGVVGAAIAYELSQIPGLQITVVDRQSPAQGSTGAALGVLMGVISQKTKGKAWQMRLTSLQRYQAWISEIEAQTGHPIPVNRNGILKLCLAGEDLGVWQTLAQTRQAQGWQLEILNPAEVRSRYPQIQTDLITGAVHSPQDFQIHPTALTLGLVAAAAQRGVTFEFDNPVVDAVISSLTTQGTDLSQSVCQEVKTARHAIAADWVIVSAGLGSTPFTTQLQQPIDIRPVLGQALHLRSLQPLSHAPSHEPVITGNDVHLVPVGKGEYWVGATVEFPTAGQELVAQAALLDSVWQQAIAFCPGLATAEVVRTWSGLRPRPEGRPAPVVEVLPGYANVIVATGHYRNGVLLAPATAQRVRELITAG